MNIVLSYVNYKKLIHSIDEYRKSHYDNSPYDYNTSPSKVGLRFISESRKDITTYTGFVINDYVYKLEVIDEPLFMLFAIKYEIEFEVEEEE